MRPQLMAFLATFSILLAAAPVSNAQSSPAAAPDAWRNDLSPISAKDWNAERAGHLLERAGFGGTPEEIARLAAMSPAEAVKSFVYSGPDASLKPFEHSGIHDPGLEPFPESRPAATERAEKTGESMGVRAKPGGNRRLQPVANTFFYWLRASALETNRVSYWWANRMVASQAPLQEKMALFWHGHFANNEDKVRDYRKLLNQLELFQTKGTGNFRDLTVAVAQDPAMLTFLDAGKNVKGAPNENFAREIMELFTMGVGNYGEKDVREAARAFTGWNYVDTKFVVNAAQHDDGQKTFLGRTGPFDGVQVIDIIMEQPVTANFMAGKLYRYFVREDLDPKLQAKLGEVLRKNKYEMKPFLEAVFLSKDFYSASSMGAQIQSPVQLAVSTYRKLGLKEAPGVPDFNQATGALGQRLFAPPTVAGWAQGKSWITPGLLLERGNFARDVLFPDINLHSAGSLQFCTRYPAGVAANPRRCGHHGGDQPGRGGDGRRIKHGRRPQRRVQHALCKLSRLADGDPAREGDSTRHRADRPERPGARAPAQDGDAGGGLFPCALSSRATGA